MKRTVFSICAGLLLSGSAMALMLEEAMQLVI